MPPFRFLGLMVCTLAVTATGQAPSYSAEVRPILADNCFRCHGPDAATREAKLRLDVPGHGAGAEVLRRIAATDRDEVMPPPHSGKTLTAGEIQTLQRWLAAGGEYERHWSFVPPVRPALPAVARGGELRPIDRFVGARLSAVGLRASPAADRTTLVRRLYLDLIGLPPTPAQARAFVEDERPDAYERLVDELLGSPHYGEHQARRWLDLARYADTNGYEKDRARSIWPWRDWVIRAFNADMPFDEFTVRQLAGDMLDGASPDDFVATGFHRNTMLNEEGGIDPLEFRFHAMADRVATTGTAFLGMTLGCAQCHTHKFDPITHREYYGLMAFLDNADEPDYLIPDAAADARVATNRERAAGQLAELWENWPTEVGERDVLFATWLEHGRDRAVTWAPLRIRAARSNLPTLRVTGRDDDTIVASGDVTKHDTYRLELAASDEAITAIRLEVLPGDQLPARGPGLTYYEGRKGDFFLTEIELTAGTGDAAQRVEFARASASYAQNQYRRESAAPELAFDGDLQTGWSTHGRNGERHVAVFVPRTPIPAGQSLQLVMHFGRHFASPLGKFRLAATSAAGGAEAIALPFDEAGTREGLLRLPDRYLSDADRRRLRDAFLLSEPAVAKQVAAIRRLLGRVEHRTTLILRERPAGERRVTHRHHRGEFLQPKEVVAPHLPEALFDGGGEQPRDRLGFARWLVSTQNPLTARVVVNREWAAFFGRGIVATVDDFGAQGALPTHPRLLDWLAVGFMADGWSMKRLHRRIVTSATYRQSSRVTAEHLARDPENLWLARAPRLRLAAEVLRDAALVAAGKLSTRRFGAPVRPPQPAGVTEIAFGRPKWRVSKGADRFRRSLYTWQKRTAPFAFHATFDAPSGELCLAQRERSDTPLQALTLLNDPMMLELAGALGDQLAKVAGGHGAEAAVRHGFERVLTREPNGEELATLARFVARRARDADGATAWAALARALFCLDEAITRS